MNEDFLHIPAAIEGFRVNDTLSQIESTIIDLEKDADYWSKGHALSEDREEKIAFENILEKNDKQLTFYYDLKKKRIEEIAELEKKLILSQTLMIYCQDSGISKIYASEISYYLDEILKLNGE